MNNWYRVVDEALVCAHLGVANEDDSYEEAKRKMNILLAYHEGVGEYFAKAKQDLSEDKDEEYIIISEWLEYK